MGAGPWEVPPHEGCPETKCGVTEVRFCVLAGERGIQNFPFDFRSVSQTKLRFTGNDLSSRTQLQNIDATSSFYFYIVRNCGARISLGKGGRAHLIRSGTLMSGLPEYARKLFRSG